MKSVGKGLYTDRKLLAQPDGYYDDALNFNFDKSPGSGVNEEGFESFITSYKDGDTPTASTVFPNNSFVIGNAPVDSNRTVLFLYSKTGLHQIGILYNTGMYEVLIRDNVLAFDYKYPIRAKAKIRNGNIIVAFVDGNNADRIINLDDMPFPSGLNSSLALNDSTEISVINVYPNDNGGSITVSKMFNSGGAIKTGSYRFFYWYETNDGGRTVYSEPTAPMIVNEDDSTDWKDYNGDVADTQTRKSILLHLTVDDTYEYVNIGVMQTVDNVTTVYGIRRFNIDSSTLEYVYTGQEDRTTIAINDYLIDSVPYKNSKVIFATNDNKLGTANLTGFVDIGYQKYANNITVRAATETVQHHSNSVTDANGVKNNVFISMNRSFMPGEVVPLYIAFKLRDGRITYGYPIPGRDVERIQPYIGNFDETTLMSTLKTIPGYEYLKADDSIQPGEVRYFHTRDTAYYSTTGMGFWQNENEYYPSKEDDPDGNWEIWDNKRKIGDLWGKNVRHHKFPTMHLNSTSDGWYGNAKKTSKVYGIYLDNVYVPSELQTEVIEIYVLSAKRTIQNQTIIGQGLLFHDQPTSNFFKAHGMDLAIAENGTLASYITNEQLFRFDVSTDPSLSTNKKYVMYDKPYPAGTRPFAESYYLRTINTLKYDPGNWHSGRKPDPGEYYYEERFQGQLGFIDATATPYLLSGSENNFLTNFCAFRQDVYTPFYDQELILVGSEMPSDTVYPKTLQPMYGGDMYACDYAFRTLEGDTSSHSALGEPTFSKRFLYVLPIMQKYNAGFRFEDEDDSTDDKYFYPKDHNNDYGWTYLRRSITTLVNKYSYDESLSKVNDVNHFVPFDYNDVSLERFPLRIKISEASSEEETTESWRTFLPNNYYDLPGNKGDIVNIESIGDELLINTTRSLFRTIGTKQLKVEQVTTYIGSGDIFSLTPQEQTLPDDGYAGCSSKYSCIKVPTGYVYVNQDRGLVFLFDTKLREISSIGMKQWFLDNLPSKLKATMLSVSSAYGTTNIDYDFDNPITGVGVLCSYDIKYKRLYVTKVDYSFVEPYIGLLSDYHESPLALGIYFDDIVGHANYGEFVYPGDSGETAVYLSDTTYFKDESWTISYSLTTNTWRSWHSFTPNMSFYNDFNIFFLKTPAINVTNTQGLFKGNVADVYGMYFDETKKESYIEFVVNDGYTISGGKTIIATNKLFEVAQWISEVFDNGHNEYLKSFTSIMVYNENQCSGIIPLTSENLKDVADTWNMNSFRDMVKDYTDNAVNSDKGVDTTDKVINSNLYASRSWYKKYYFNGKYLVIRLIYDNVDQNELYLHGYGAKFQMEYR